ncbi:RNA polymerase sigma factor [compost metagenome]
MNKADFQDTELLRLLRLGNEQALTEIYKKYWKKLYLAAHRMLNDSQTCEDIVQNIFVKIWNKREDLIISGSVIAYLTAWMRYEVFKQIRSGNIREDIFDDLQERVAYQSESGNLEYKELVERINTVVGGLPEKCREVYLLSREKNLSHKEIARELNISTKTVENHITRALTQLRVSLGDVLILEFAFILLKK